MTNIQIFKKNSTINILLKLQNFAKKLNFFFVIPGDEHFSQNGFKKGFLYKTVIE